MKIRFYVFLSVALFAISGGVCFFKHAHDEARLTPISPTNSGPVDKNVRMTTSSIENIQTVDNEKDRNDDVVAQKQMEKIQGLIARIGRRAIPLNDSHSLGELASKSKSDRFDPLGTVFPFAQELVDIGPQAVIPIAKYWATLRDPSSDDYIASLRALKTLLRENRDIHLLYLKLAEKAENQGEKIQYEKAASRFESNDAEKP